MSTVNLRERMEYYEAMIRYAEKQRDDIKHVLDIEADAMRIYRGIQS